MKASLALVTLLSQCAFRAVSASPPFIFQQQQQQQQAIDEIPTIDNDLAGYEECSSCSGAHLAPLDVEQHQSIMSRLRETLSSLLSSDDDHLDRTQAGSNSAEFHDQHGIIDLSHLTINEILEASLKRHHEHDDGLWGWHKPSPENLPLHRIAWVVNQSSEAQKALDKDDITLLAPDDLALTPPHRRGPPRLSKRLKRHEKEAILAEIQNDDATFEMQPHRHPFMHSMRDDKDHDNKDERRERFEKIIAFFLRYHVLDKARRPTELADHATAATTLKEGRDSDTALRVRIEPSWGGLRFPHPSIKFNFYSTARGPVVAAKNGYIILVSAPLFPPLTPLNNAFLFPTFFSTLTSDVQKVDLAKDLLPALDEPEFESESMIQEVVDELIKEHPGTWTLFAPTNWAFTRLGFKVNAFLHSPFPLSRRILRYVLAYHLVPDVAFYSDHIGSDGDRYIVGTEIDVEVRLPEFEPTSFPRPSFPHVPMPGGHKRPPHDGPHKPPHGPPHGPPRGPPHHPPSHPLPHANVTHYEFPTLLSTSKEGNPNATLRVDVVTYRSFFGKGPIERKIIIQPASEHHHGHGDHDHHGDHGHNRDHDAVETMKWAKREKKQKRWSWWGRSEKGDKKKARKAGKKGGCRKQERLRDDWVLLQPPHHPPHHGPPQHLVKVIARDVVARYGAVHVLHEVLRPPMPHRDHDHDGDHKHELRGHLRALFA